MLNTAGSSFIWKSGSSAVVAVWWIVALSTIAVAQTPGQNAIYNSSSNCCAGSSAFLDATQFAGSVTQPNFCSVLNYMLNPQNGVITSTAVIDARGLPKLGTVSMTCSASPWNAISSPPPVTILLPATGGSTPHPIVISNTWVLPGNTHLVGEGDDIGTGSIGAGTTIQASSSVNGSMTMIQFGNSTFCPSAIHSGLALYIQ
jgi:hypothetical protein